MQKNAIPNKNQKALIKKRGLDHKCFYHISDEPHLDALDHYRACKNIVAPYLEGYPIIDALSELEFYTSGAIDKPVPNTRSVHKFHAAGVPGLWTYYCGGGRAGVADRSISMPSFKMMRALKSRYFTMLWLMESAWAISAVFMPRT